jgi:hypothetical protein
MAFAIHALQITRVVTLLVHISRRPGRIGADKAPRQQARARADSRALAPVKRCAGRRANSCTNGGARNGAGYCCTVRRRSSDPLLGKLPAIVIVVAELLETFARAWEGHYAGAGRNAGARGQRGYRHQG